MKEMEKFNSDFPDIEELGSSFDPYDDLYDDWDDIVPGRDGQHDYAEEELAAPIEDIDIDELFNF